MKQILYFFLLFVSVSLSAQKYVIGKVTMEADTKVPGVIVYNVRSEEMIETDSNGNFIIKANVADELRFIKRNFDRVSLKVRAEDFDKPMNVSIQLLPQLIEEVEIAFIPTGNLKKDVRALDRPKKVEALNNAMANSMRIPPERAYPSNRMPSTLQTGPNFSAGQVDVLGAAKALIGLVQRKVDPKTTPNYAEKQAFYRRVKETVDLQYFYDRGLDEFQFEMLIVYADNKYNLAKNFRTGFTRTMIENYLKSELKEFMDTKLKPASSPS